ncbi:MAG TPA: ATP-binding protein [Anaeromyxobacteraceae bacterium]|nr:ATP-binding protein [Anaeromyxobacteraceae bacterium]
MIAPLAGQGRPGPVERLRGWAGSSLRHQLSLATVLLTAAVVLPAAALSLTLSARLARREAEERLAAQAELAASRLGQVLVAAQSAVADVARSPLLATALVDAHGWQQYGVPYLRQQHLPFVVSSRLALCDFRGRIVGATDEPPTVAPVDWVGTVIERGEWLARIHERGAAAHLLVLAPVRYPGTGTVEGAVAAELPVPELSALAFQRNGEALLLDGEGRPLGGQADAGGDEVAAVRRLDLPPPLDELRLAVEVRMPAGEASRPLRLLLVLHAVGAVVVLLGGLVFSRWLAGRLTRSLRTLAASAEAIAASGAIETGVAVASRDETGRLAEAFNAMLWRLRQAHDAAEAVHRSEQAEARGQLLLAHAALERSHDAISIVEPSGRVAFANEAACRLFGRPRQALAGRPIQEAGPLLADARWAEVWRDVQACGLVVAERSVRLATGLAGWVELTVHPLALDGRDYAVVVVRDVTARRQAEAASRLAGVGTLAAGAAHEINNPLGGVLGNLTFLRDGLAGLGEAVPPARREEVAELSRAVEDAREGATRVRDVVRSLKSFSRPDEGEQEPTDLAAVVESAVGLTRHDLRHRARVTTRFEPAPAVLASGRRLEQVFVNLLVNAAQAIPEGRAEENEVAVSVGPGPGGQVVAEVRDTGAGMTPEVRAHLFEPFFTTKPVGSGTGLGLAICHGIVSAHGGRIEVESAPGAGSTFRVVLPAPGAA